MCVLEKRSRYKYVINQHDLRDYIINQHDIRDYIINQHDIRAYIVNQHDIRAYIINQYDIRAYIINQHDIRDYIINQHDIRDYIINTLKQNTSDILNEYTNQLTNRLKHGTGILSILMRLGKLCTTVTRSEPVHGDIRCGHSPIIVTEHVY